MARRTPVTGEDAATLAEIGLLTSMMRQHASQIEGLGARRRRLIRALRTPIQGVRVGRGGKDGEMGEWPTVTYRVTLGQIAEKMGTTEMAVYKQVRDDL